MKYFFILLFALPNIVMGQYSPQSDKTYKEWMPNNPFQEWMLNGVYQIRLYKNNVATGEGGTAFVLDLSGEKYVITARHIAKSDHDAFVLFDGQSVRPFSAKFHCLSEKEAEFADVAVAYLGGKTGLVAIDSSAVNINPMYRIGSISIYVGFPVLNNKYGSVNYNSNVDHTIFPLVKIGRVSGYDQFRSLYVDAMNITGFSGAPVYVFNDLKQKFTLAGIVSGYANQPVYDTVDTTHLLQPRYYANSGLTLCAFSSYIYEIIGQIHK